MKGPLPGFEIFNGRLDPAFVFVEGDGFPPSHSCHVEDIKTQDETENPKSWRRSNGHCRRHHIQNLGPFGW